MKIYILNLIQNNWADTIRDAAAADAIRPEAPLNVTSKYELPPEAPLKIVMVLTSPYGTVIGVPIT